jgi:hypothetical protein
MHGHNVENGSSCKKLFDLIAWLTAIAADSFMRAEKFLFGA